MRRPRSKLQVSTFPFLAVLLGAMGSLIFLLLIMDRRAKIVARNKAREIYETRQAAQRQAHDEARNARQAAWEQQRLELHEALAREQTQVRGQMQEVAGQLTSLASVSEQGEVQRQKLLDAITHEQTTLQAARRALQDRQSTLLKSAQLEETTRAEHARLSRELLELQQLADALKRMQGQERPSYSLVPYRGQRGASRMPIYVECTRDGLQFLPEHKRFGGPDLDVPGFRAEVERRHGPLAKHQRNADPFRTPESDKPYVLFLVRPDGVLTYSLAQSALRGYEIDYGYELVDADWSLRVPSTEEFAKLLVSEPQAPSRQAPTARGPGKGDAQVGPGAVSLGAPAPLLVPPSEGAPTSPQGGTANLEFRPSGERPRASPAPTEPPADMDQTFTASTEGSALERLAPPRAATAKKASPLPVQPVMGNRELIINLACYADGVVITPGGAAFNWTAAANARQVNEALVQTVRELIARRQATVRPGETPHRVVLRFVVHREGLRTMFRAYPLLESLRLPMVREDVEE
jgi:hypothetical protein